MGIKFTNNAYGTLANSALATDLTLNLTPGNGARFPVLNPGDWFYGTLVDSSGNIEIVKVTARATDALTVTRGVDNTTARAFSAGDKFELHLTAAGIQDIEDSSVRTGTVIEWYAAATPSGTNSTGGDLYIEAGGQAESRTLYAGLFALWGTTFGAGDGSTTFNVVDKRDRVAVGKGDMGGAGAAGRLTMAHAGFDSTQLGNTGGDEQLHQHDHPITDPQHDHPYTDPQHDHPGGRDSGGAGVGSGWGGTFTGLLCNLVSTGLASIGITINNAATNITVNNFGGGHSENVQPGIVARFLIHT